MGIDLLLNTTVPVPLVLPKRGLLQNGSSGTSNLSPMSFLTCRGASSQIQLDSSCRGSPESSSSAQKTKIGLLISPVKSSLLHIPAFSKVLVPGSLKKSPVSSRTKILRGPSVIPECWEAAEPTEVGTPYLNSPTCSRVCHVIASSSPGIKACPLSPEVAPQGSVSVPEPLLTKKQVNVLSATSVVAEA